MDISFIKQITPIYFNRLFSIWIFISRLHYKIEMSINLARDNNVDKDVGIFQHEMDLCQCEFSNERSVVK